MKKIHSFKLYFLIILLSFVLVVQPTLIIYYAKGEEEQHWELVNSSNVYEGQFSEDTQEVVFVYRKKERRSVPTDYSRTDYYNASFHSQAHLSLW
ncbi:hypothetical protein GQR36_14720 [Enterococcus termitis]